MRMSHEAKKEIAAVEASYEVQRAIERDSGHHAVHWNRISYKPERVCFVN